MAVARAPTPNLRKLAAVVPRPAELKEAPQPRLADDSNKRSAILMFFIVAPRS
jgi:hypothetical protein